MGPEDGGGPGARRGAERSEGEFASLVEEVRKGSRPALARAISLVENEERGFEDFLERALRGVAPHARRLGITGPPGVGKSTVVAALARGLRGRGERVGVLAVDPSSPYSGGALLGDRIRLGALGGDAGVFIRSMASRGLGGGLAGAAREVLDLMDVAGFDRLLLETVGVGQTELEVAAATETVAVVLMPGQGDEVQAMKAGLMEIGDLFVVNKGDLPGVEEAARALRDAIALRAFGQELWVPPVLVTEAISGKGIPELIEAADRHWSHLESSSELSRRRRERARRRVLDVLERGLRRELRGVLDSGVLSEEEIDQVASGGETAHATARRIRDRGSAPPSGE